MVISLVDYRKKREEQAKAPSAGEDLRQLQKTSDRVSALAPEQRKIVDGLFGITTGKPDPSMLNRPFSAKQDNLLAESLRSLRKNAIEPKIAEAPKLKLVR